MKYIFYPHAMDRMKEREVTAAEVIGAIKKSQIRTPCKHPKRRRIISKIKHKSLNVIIEEDELKEKVYIVSVAWL